jgi:hypothetical protein
MMDPETIAALRGSIAKWQAIVDGTGTDQGIDNCPLCARFYDTEDDDATECALCPVRMKTGQPNCVDTPYLAWARSWPFETYTHPVHMHKRITDAPEELRGTIRAAAQAELDFLISLLPEGDAP